MHDDTRLLNTIVPLLELTTPEHDIYKSSICNYEEQNNIAQLLRRKILTIAVMLYNS